MPWMESHHSQHNLAFRTSHSYVVVKYNSSLFYLFLVVVVLTDDDWHVLKERCFIGGWTQDRVLWAKQVYVILINRISCSASVWIVCGETAGESPGKRPHPAPSAGSRWTPTVPAQTLLVHPVQPTHPTINNFNDLVSYLGVERCALMPRVSLARN